MNECVQRCQGKAQRKSPELAEAIQIDDIEIFERVVATSSMSAAARELQISPRGVCNRIRRFEKRLGMKLFHRTTREVRTTPPGQGLYDSVRCKFFVRFRKPKPSWSSLMTAPRPWNPIQRDGSAQACGLLASGF